MNCQQVENLLPLYVSRDLDEGRAQLVDTHAQSCAACADAAAEYRETRRLLQEFAPPEFSEGVYAEMRQTVWREIEAESNAPALAGLIAGWLPSRLVWASAIALLITVSALGIYFISGRWKSQQTVAGKPATINPNSENEPKEKESPTPRLALNGGNKTERAVAGPRRQQRIARKVVPDQPNLLALNAPGTASNSTQPLTVNTAESSAPSNKDSARALRFEIQTKNPNIRIIWFAQRDNKQVSPNSKGI